MRTMNDGLNAGDDAGRELDELFASDRDRTGGDMPAAEPSEHSDGPPRDEMGRFAPREPEAQAAPPQEQPEPEAIGEQPVEDNGMVPRSALIAERKKYQEREQALQAEIDNRVNQTVQQYMQQFQQPQYQQPYQQADELPDIFEDPDTAVSLRVQQAIAPIQQQMMQQMDQWRFSMAMQTHGQDKLQAALNAVQQAGLVEHFRNHPDPYNAVVDWHKQASTLNEIGGDLDSYRQRLEQEVREKVLAELKQGGGQPQQQRFPTTLADRTNAGMGVSGTAVHPEAQLNEMFSSSRDRRYG